MTKYIVQGGHPLFGEVRISGAKNAAVAIIPAALLVDGVCRIENIPQISDVTALLKILEQLGANVRFLNRSDVEIDCRHIATTQVSQELAHKIRDGLCIIRAQVGQVARLAEVELDGDEFVLEVDLLKAGGLHEAAQLFERADLIRAQIGKIYFCRFHWKYLRDQKTFSFSGGPPPAFLILLCLRGTVNRKKAPDT